MSDYLIIENKALKSLSDDAATLPAALEQATALAQRNGRVMLVVKVVEVVAPQDNPNARAGKTV